MFCIYVNVQVDTYLLVYAFCYVLCGHNTCGLSSPTPDWSALKIALKFDAAL